MHAIKKKHSMGFISKFEIADSDVRFGRKEQRKLHQDDHKRGLGIINDHNQFMDY